MARSRALDRAIEQVEAAHRRFQVGALKALHPNLRGAALAAAVAHEALRDSQYVENMRRRLTEGTRNIEQGALTPAERQRRHQTLITTEKRYLTQHIEAAGWRMRSEADMSRLKEAGEPGAVWLLDNGKRTHTADCLALEGRFWTWDVLDRVNPGNRHPGCGCRLVSLREAQRLGVPVKRGYRAKRVRQELQEAFRPTKTVKRVRLAQPANTIAVPRFGSRFNWREALHPRDHRGRFKRVAGTLPVELHPDLDAWRDAVVAGDSDEMARVETRLLKRAKSVSKKERRMAVQTVQRMQAAVVNPKGAQHTIGATTRLGGEEVSIPLTQHTTGIVDPWTGDKTFAWLVEDSPSGRRLAFNASKGEEFTVRKTRKGSVLEIDPSIPLPEARALARELEIQRNDLRRVRSDENGESIEDDRPLNVGKDEKGSNTGPTTTYPEVRIWELGIAGELGAYEIRDRLQAMGIVPMDDDRLTLPAGHDGDPYSPLDMLIGEFGIESKAKGMRAYLLGASGGGGSKVKADQILSKRAAASRGQKLRATARAHFESVKGRAKILGETKAKGLRPATLVHLIDADAGVQHVFFHEYPDEDTAFRSIPRIPVEMGEKLMAGELQPGQLMAPQGGKMGGDETRGTRYVGSFPLRYNPLRKDDRARDLPPEEILNLAQRKAEPPVDKGLDTANFGLVKSRKDESKKKVKKQPGNPKRLSKEERAKQLGPELRRMQKQGMTQGEMANALGVSQKTISEYFAILRKSPGRGTRTDLKKGKRPKVA